MKKIFFVITILFIALFFASFNVNESKAILTQCNDYLDNEPDGQVDFMGFHIFPADTDCCCHLDNTEDNNSETGPFYISFQDPGRTFVSVASDCSSIAIAPTCLSYNGDSDGCATGWNCSANDVTASCHVGISGTVMGACSMWAGTNCNTPYDACNCTCGACTADGGACSDNTDCCSNDCTGLVCIATVACANIGEACSDDSDCCDSNCDTVAGACIAAVVVSGVCGDNNCDYDDGENMFNCKADCLPAGGGIPTKLIPDVIDSIISWLLTFAIAIAVLILVYGGVCYVFSSGDTQKTEDARKVIKYALLGIFIAGISYAIITIADQIFH